MPEPHELDELDLATEQQLLALLELPLAPPALDERVLAAARVAAATPAADRQPSPALDTARPRGLLLRFPFQQAAAAAAILIAAGLSASLTAPHDELLSSTPRDEPFAVGSVAQVLGAEGAFGASAQPMLVGASVAQGEPLAVQTGGFLRLRLECGTELVLDGGTTGALHFDHSARRLQLEHGRLYAQVVKVGTFVGRFGREYRPLVVETPGGRARVLGTELTVRAVGARARVTVRKGTVRLENDHGHSLVTASQSGLLVTDSAPTTRRLGSVDRQFRWIGKIQAGERHPAEKPFGGVVSDGEPAIGALIARLPSGEAAHLALAEQAVETEVRDGLSRTTISFLFRNPTALQLEGTFRFALPKDASIRRYAVETRGELREGRVIEREAARAIYREQKARMEAPALLEWSRGSAFTAKVFPIEPSATKRLVIAYEQVLPERNGISRLLLPLVSEAASAHPPERLTVDVRLSGPEGGAALRCPSHNVRAFREGADLVLRLEAEGLTPRNDFILEMSRPAAPIVEGRIEEGADGEPASVLVRVRPDLSWAAERLARGPLVVLCDGSASQAGTLKEVQLEVLEALMETDGDRRTRAFVYHVGLDELPSGSADALLGGLWRARTEGAADLAQAFRRLATKLPPDGGATLVYLGDGSSSAGQRADHQVLRALRRSLPPAAVRRVVTVGIGADVNQSLLTRVARERSGVYVGVRPGDHLGRKLDEVLSAVREPVLTQIQARIEVPGVHEVAPQTPVNLRVGEVLDLSARLSGEARRGWLVLSGLLGGEVFEARAPLRLESTPQGERLADLWARRRIDDLREQGPAGKDEITDLALYHGLVSPHTSLLVVSDEEYSRAQARRRAAQARPAQALLLEATEALDGERFDEAQRLALRARRKAPAAPMALQLLAAVARARQANESETSGELIEHPGDAGPVTADPTESEASLGGEEWLHARASLGLPREEPVLELHDVSDLLSRVPDFPAPELGLSLKGRKAGGGGGGGGVLSFDSEEEGEERLDPDELVELLESRLPDGSVELSRGQLIVKNTPEAQAEIRKVLGDLRRTRNGIPDFPGDRIRVAGDGKDPANNGGFRFERDSRRAPGHEQQQQQAAGQPRAQSPRLSAAREAIRKHNRQLEERRKEESGSHAHFGRQVPSGRVVRDGRDGSKDDDATRAREIAEAGLERALAQMNQALDLSKEQKPTSTKNAEALAKTPDVRRYAKLIERYRATLAEGEDGAGPLLKDASERRETAEGQTARLSNLRGALEKDLKKLRGLEDQQRALGDNGLSSRSKKGGKRAAIEDYELSSGGTGKVVDELQDRLDEDHIATDDWKKTPESKVKKIWKRSEKLGEKRGDLTIDLPRTREKAIESREDTLSQSGSIPQNEFNNARRAAITQRGEAKNEKASIGALKTIGAAQSLFRESDKEADGNLDYGTLEELSKAGETGLIDSVLGSGTRNGYLFEAAKKGGAEDLSFAWNAKANPALPGTTGDRYFATNHEGVTYYTTKKLRNGYLETQLPESALWHRAEGRYELDAFFATKGAETTRAPLDAYGLISGPRGPRVGFSLQGDPGFVPDVTETTTESLYSGGTLGVVSDVEVDQTGTIPVLNPLFLQQLTRGLDMASSDQRPAVFEQTLAVVRSYRSAGVSSALVPLLRDMLRYAPQRQELHEHLGASFQSMGRPRAALRAYSGLVEAKPDDAEAHWRYASALLRLELPGRALVEAREASRLRPDVARYRLGHAALALQLGRTSEAETALRAVLARNFHPEQGDVASQARVMLQALWAESLRKNPELLARNLRALHSGALQARPLRVLLQLTSGEGRLLVEAPGEERVSPGVPFTAAGGRLVSTEDGASYSHSGPAAGTWTLRVAAGPKGAEGILRVVAGQRSWQVPLKVSPNQTATVFTHALAR